MDEQRERTVEEKMQEEFRQKARAGDATYALAYALMVLAERIQDHEIAVGLGLGDICEQIGLLDGR